MQPHDFTKDDSTLSSKTNDLSRFPPKSRAASDPRSPHRGRRPARPRRARRAPRRDRAAQRDGARRAPSRGRTSRGEILRQPQGPALHRRQGSPRRAARLEGHPDGFGFLMRDDGGPTISFRGRSRCTRRCTATSCSCASPASTAAGAPRARSSRCSNARTSEVVGRLFIERAYGFVVAENKRINQDLIIPAENRKARRSPATSSSSRSSSTRPQSASRSGASIEILGNDADPGMEIEIALRKHDAAVRVLEGCARRRRSACRPRCSTTSAPGRVDLTRPAVRHDRRRDREGLRRRGLVRAQGQGLPARGRDRRRLALREADGDAIDEDARERATSVYFPRRVIPMLPEELSQRALLAEARSRPAGAWSADMEVTANGDVRRYEFYPA